MSSIYTTGDYLDTTETWHAEDSPWKAEQVLRMLKANRLRPQQVAEIGCGAGRILAQLAEEPYLAETEFVGYDISPQAIEMCKKIENPRIGFYRQDMFAEELDEPFDVLLVIDVIEHVPDYLTFAESCRPKATYKIYHIPLDLHVSSVLRNRFIENRYSIGHLHYFTAESALATLRDTGNRIVDYFYTNSALGLFEHHSSFKTALANVPRWLFSKVSVPLTARLFGGYSLLVLAT